MGTYVPGVSCLVFDMISFLENLINVILALEKLRLLHSVLMEVLFEVRIIKIPTITRYLMCTVKSGTFVGKISTLKLRSSSVKNIKELLTNQNTEFQCAWTILKNLKGLVSLNRAQERVLKRNLHSYINNIVKRLKSRHKRTCEPKLYWSLFLNWEGLRHSFSIFFKRNIFHRDKEAWTIQHSPL